MIPTRTVLLAVAAMLVWTPAETAAQPKRISLDLSDVAETDVGHAGTTYRVALEAQLEPRGTGLHVNSNEPLESFLIATVLTLEPPEGIALDGLAWPTPVMLDQQGAEKPLAVFDERFVIGAALRLSDDLEPGTYPVSGSLRYQACDDRMCYLPTRVPVGFDVTVAPPSRDLTRTAAAGLFDSLSFAALAPDAVADAAADVEGGPGPGSARELAAAAPAGDAPPAAGRAAGGRAPGSARELGAAAPAGDAPPAADGATGLERLGPVGLLRTGGYAGRGGVLGVLGRGRGTRLLPRTGRRGSSGWRSSSCSALPATRTSTSSSGSSSAPNRERRSAGGSRGAGRSRSSP